MSLILDALNKADQERNRDNPPSLNSRHDKNKPEFGASGNRSMLMLLTGALVIITLLLFYFFFVHDASDQHLKDITSAPSVTVLTAEAEQGPTVSVASAPEKVAPFSEISDTRAPQRKTSYDEIRKKLVAAQYQDAEREEREQNTEGKTDGGERGTESRAEAAEQAQVTSIYEQRDTAQTPQAQTKPKGNTLSDHPDITLIGELPYSVQKKIPTIMYTAHNYRAAPASVTLNNSQRRKGQTIADNVVLEEILENGIILRHESRRFKMMALNSWVNM